MDAVKRNQGQEGPRGGAKNDRGGAHYLSMLAPSTCAWLMFNFDAQLPAYAATEHGKVQGV
jgi:hypothetical protein